MTHPEPPLLTDLHVGVEVRYLEEHSRPGRAAFAYVIRIENRGDQTWQLMARHWDIVDGTGRQTSVDGEGVVGEQPVLPPGGVFVYDSFVTLEATPGRMGGHYLLRDAWGGLARARVPDFALSVPGRDERVLN